MNAHNQLLPVQFAGATLYIINQNDQPFVPMRPVVEGMGLDWATQFTKIKQRFETSVVEITTQMSGDNQRRQFVCLPLAKLAGWLYSISPNKVNPEVRDKVIQYQAECDQVLFDYWTKGLAVRPSVTGDSVGPLKPRFDPWFALVSDWLASDECAKVNVFHMSDILQGALHYPPSHVAQMWQMIRVGNIMHKLGFIKRRESAGIYRRWYYERGNGMLLQSTVDVLLAQGHRLSYVDACSIAQQLVGQWEHVPQAASAPPSAQLSEIDLYNLRGLLNMVEPLAQQSNMLLRVSDALDSKPLRGIWSMIDHMKGMSFVCLRSIERLERLDSAK